MKYVFTEEQLWNFVDDILTEARAWNDGTVNTSDCWEKFNALLKLPQTGDDCTQSVSDTERSLG